MERGRRSKTWNTILVRKNIMSKEGLRAYDISIHRYT
jgi:hypothetical protein